MTSDPRLELRVSRLENDSGALYEIATEIKTVQDDHTRRLDGIDTRLDGIDTRLEGIDTTLREVLRRLPEPV